MSTALAPPKLTIRPRNTRDAAIGLGASAGAGALLGYAVGGNVSNSLQFGVLGGAAYGGTVAVVYAKDELSGATNFTADILGGEGSATELFLNPFHGGIAGHGASYTYGKGKEAYNYIEKNYPNKGYDPKNSNWFEDALNKGNDWLKSLFS
jgi:hypothetical protein